MKGFIKNLFNVHEIIGKMLILICIVITIGGSIFGITKCSKENEVVSTNYFLNENVPIHSNNYIVIVRDVHSVNYISIIDKKGNIVEKEGYFIEVNLVLNQISDSLLKKHTIDSNDFKLKDHTGLYVPLNDIMGVIGWDAIDLHIDEENGGHVMSSTEFSTISSIEDYRYVGIDIEPGNELIFSIFFEMSNDIQAREDLIVLEIDFYNFSYDFRRGTDIILLPRPNNLE